MGLIGRIVAVFAALGLIAVAGAGGYAYHELSPAGTNQESLYLVRRGDSLYQVSEALQSKHILRNAQFFRLLARSKGWQHRLQTGYYRLNGKQSASEILDWLANGKTEKIPYTIPEGYRIDQAAAKLGDYDLSPQKYESLARNPSSALLQTYPFLLKTSGQKSLEGYLFPDTYYLSGSEDELIEAQLSRFRQLILPLWEQRPASHPLNLDQTIKLASIVELEGLLERELPVIAAVFLKRLKLGMKLESDPTTEYALGWHQGPKGLSLKDIQIDSPYNTYRYHGLPPTPIGNPGMAAIKAVLHPAQTDYLYFVARGDGSHAFSRTYQEHLNAIRRIMAGKS